MERIKAFLGKRDYQIKLFHKESTYPFPSHSQVSKRSRKLFIKIIRLTYPFPSHSQVSKRSRKHVSWFSYSNPLPFFMLSFNLIVIKSVNSMLLLHTETIFMPCFPNQYFLSEQWAFFMSFKLSNPTSPGWSGLVSLISKEKAYFIRDVACYCTKVLINTNSRKLLSLINV